MHQITAREIVFTNQCPRCSSSRIVVSDDEFVCMSCSLVAQVEW